MAKCKALTGSAVKGLKLLTLRHDSGARLASFYVAELRTLGSTAINAGIPHTRRFTKLISNLCNLLSELTCWHQNQTLQCVTNNTGWFYCSLDSESSEYSYYSMNFNIMHCSRGELLVIFPQKWDHLVKQTCQSMSPTMKNCPNHSITTQHQHADTLIALCTIHTVQFSAFPPMHQLIIYISNPVLNAITGDFPRQKSADKQKTILNDSRLMLVQLLSTVSWVQIQLRPI